MTYTTDEFNYTLVFLKGEEVVQVLLDFIKEKDIKAGWVLGLGGLSQATLGCYALADKTYHWSDVAGDLELTNLTGNMAWQDGEPVLHLHATISDESLVAKGGHLKAAVVAGTVEVLIHTWDSDKRFNRAKDKATGLNLLDL